MIASRASAERRAEVRSAARAWHGAGAIDDATLERIEAAYPDDRPRMALAWKVLVFVIVTIAVNALFFGVATLIHRESGPTTWLVFAAVLAAATELLLHRSRIGENGSGAATSFWAALYATIGCGLGLERDRSGGWEDAVTISLLAAAIAFAVACWRWGYAAEGVIGAVALFLLLARFPSGRLWWIVVGGLLAAAAWPARERRALAPSFRRVAAGVFAVSTLALYAAINRYSLDQRLIEAMGRSRAATSAPQAVPLVLASSLATAAVPLVLIVWGVRRRKTLVLDLGLLLAALSLVTLRYYVHLAALWVILFGAGAALVLAALGLNRWLRVAPNGERRGFTGRPLFSDRGTGLETAAIAAAFAPDARPAPAPDSGGLTPGGGRFGGGGATGDF